MHSMNGVVLGSKQIVVRLHEPKQLRQEKLAQRFAGGHNGHPRSRSGATSPTASEGGESLTGWPSPRGGYQGLGSPGGHGPVDRVRRSSGSFYNVRGTYHLLDTHSDFCVSPGCVGRSLEHTNDV
jgi:polyadenylate-binding protein